jgi:hypothetical protein
MPFTKMSVFVINLSLNLQGFYPNYADLAFAVLNGVVGSGMKRLQKTGDAQQSGPTDLTARRRYCESETNLLVSNL